MWVLVWKILFFSACPAFWAVVSKVCHVMLLLDSVPRCWLYVWLYWPYIWHYVIAYLSDTVFWYFIIGVEKYHTLSQRTYAKHRVESVSKTRYPFEDFAMCRRFDSVLMMWNCKLDVSATYSLTEQCMIALILYHRIETAAWSPN